MPTTSRPRRTRFGAFDVDWHSGEIYKHGIRLKLQEQPFQVLALLMERPGELVTRDELRQTLWPEGTFVDFDTGLNSAVKKLRDALGDDADEPQYIETVPRRGYRFIAPIGEIQPSPGLPLHAPLSDSEKESANTDLSEQTGSPVKAQARFTLVRLLVFLTLAILVLGISGLVLYLSSVSKRASRATIKSLAVLPLQNFSGDQTEQYLADGMTEALTGRLSGIHGLRVISRTSVMRFRDARLAVPDIARTLGVDAVVEGSVIRQGSRVRVQVQLIRAATDEHIWSEVYDRDLRDVLALESDIAQAVAQKVEVTVTGEEHSRLIAARNVAPEVYESYLKARFAKGNTRAEIDQSIASYQEAINKDSTFAPAYVGLAEAYNRLGGGFVGLPPEDVRPKVLAAVQKALKLDPELADGHALLASVYQERWQWADAEAEYKRALELNPNDSTASLGYAKWLMCQGRMDEALSWSRRARELDPLGVTGVVTGQILFFARRYDEAIQELRSVVAVRPDEAGPLWLLGTVLVFDHQPQEAIHLLEKSASGSAQSPGVIGGLVRAYSEAGRRADALRCLNELKRRQKTGYVPAAAFVDAYLALGERDQAFVWFERAYREQADFLQWLKVHPFFDPVRDDPRFKDLLHRVGLDQPR
jgi:TolB-like protein/DNA-binding winged helix-turn-helix (wHTH) protein